MTRQSFFYRKEGVLKRINLDEILFMEAADNYVKFYALNYFHVVRASLNAVLSQLPENMFVQIHRSFAVAVNHLDTVGKDFITFLSVPDKALPVSKKYYAGLLEKIRIIEAASPDSVN